MQGTITEDSDVLLFGSRNVYRHFFEEQKFTQYYDMRRIEKSLGLDREQLCLLALFLGSDYTEGVKGVGIVNGMEVVSTFRDLPSIKRFSAWAGDVQDNVKKSRKEKYSHGEDESDGRDPPERGRGRVCEAASQFQEKLDLPSKLPK